MKNKENKTTKYLDKTVIGLSLLCSLEVSAILIETLTLLEMVRDDSVNHMNELCLQTSLMNMFGKDENNVPLGVTRHQIPQIEKELQERGIEDAIVQFFAKEDNAVYYDNKVIYSEAITMEDGKKAYIIPEENLKDTSWMINILDNSENKPTYQKSLQENNSDLNTLVCFEMIFNNDGSKSYKIPEEFLKNTGWTITTDNSGIDKLETNVLKIMPAESINAYWNFTTIENSEKTTPKNEAVLVLKK